MAPMFQVQVAYHILTHSRIEDLDTEVNEMMEEQWQCLGPPFTYASMINQTMVRTAFATVGGAAGGGGGSGRIAVPNRP